MSAKADMSHRIRHLGSARDWANATFDAPPAAQLGGESALASSATEPVYSDEDPERFEGWWTEVPGCQGAWGLSDAPG